MFQGVYFLILYHLLLLFLLRGLRNNFLFNYHSTCLFLAVFYLFLEKLFWRVVLGTPSPQWLSSHTEDLYQRAISRRNNRSLLCSECNQCRCVNHDCTVEFILNERIPGEEKHCMRNEVISLFNYYSHVSWL